MMGARFFSRQKYWLVLLVFIGVWLWGGCSGPSGSPALSGSTPSVRLTEGSPRVTLSPVPSPSPVRSGKHVKAAPVDVPRPAVATSRGLSLSLSRGATAVEVPYQEGAYGLPPLPRVITYTVKPGDTLSTIAARFGVSMDALRWSNPAIEHNPDDLYPGDVLRIPPVNGVVVEVKSGDTIERLARRYHVPPDAIRKYAANRLRPPYTLSPGQWVVIPGGHKEIDTTPPRAYPGYAYMWPARGIITQHYHAHHHGVDIAGPYGSFVYASRSGRVRTVRWDNSGYGYMVIIDHGDGWNTLYAHLKGALVHPGQWVQQGEVIGRMGGTGRATGPHVHFEIRKGRVRYDPEKFLPPTP